MKKITTLAMLAFAFCLTFSTTNVKAQAIEQGNVLIDAYYGWPNLWTAVLKSAVTSDNSTGVKVGTFGPVGGRVEYLLSDKIGLGLDVQTANSNVQWTDSTYDYKVSVNRLRFCPRLNIHFSDNDKLDFYGAFGIGYKSNSLVVESSDPNYDKESVNVDFTPVTWRAAIGIRYFFTDNIGAGLEMGLGGVLSTFGLALKF